jgi:hypothetical protein
MNYVCFVVKTCAALAFVNVKQEDKGNFQKLVVLAKENYNDKRDHILKTIGGGKLGLCESCECGMCV